MSLSKKPPLTHFLSIPLVTPTSRPRLSLALSSLRTDLCTPNVLGGPPLLPPDAIRPVGSLHLTLGVMSLQQQDSLDRAVDLLQTLRAREILAGAMTSATASAPDESSSLLLSLRGLRPMGNPAKASILYASPLDAAGTLQRFSEAVRALFLAEGLVVDEARPLLLHATLVRTGQVKDGAARGRGGGAGGKRGRRGHKLEIDATDLVARYEDRVWIDGVALDRLAICRMGAKPVIVNGEPDAEYTVEAELAF